MIDAYTIKQDMRTWVEKIRFHPVKSGGHRFRTDQRKQTNLSWEQQKGSQGLRLPCWGAAWNQLACAIGKQDGRVNRALSHHGSSYVRKAALCECIMELFVTGGT